MEIRAKGHFEPLTWLMLKGLIGVGVIGAAWNLLKPGARLFRVIDLIVRNQPIGFYCIVIGVLGLLAGKAWLDEIDPRALCNLSSATWAFTGTLFILSLLLPV